MKQHVGSKPCVETSIVNLTGQRFLFFFTSTRIFFGLDSNLKISNRVCSHDSCLVFFSFMNIYFANLDSCFFIVLAVFYKFRLMYYVFNMFLPSV